MFSNCSGNSYWKRECFEWSIHCRVLCNLNYHLENSNLSGQGDIQEILEKATYPLAYREIVEICENSERSIRRLLKNMITHREVEFIELDRKLAMEIYNCKKKMRLYFLTENASRFTKVVTNDKQLKP